MTAFGRAGRRWSEGGVRDFGRWGLIVPNIRRRGEGMRDYGALQSPEEGTKRGGSVDIFGYFHRARALPGLTAFLFSL